MEVPLRKKEFHLPLDSLPFEPATSALPGSPACQPQSPPEPTPAYVLNIYLSIHPPTHPAIHLISLSLVSLTLDLSSACVSICVSLYPSMYLSLFLPLVLFLCRTLTDTAAHKAWLLALLPPQFPASLLPEPGCKCRGLLSPGMHPRTPLPEVSTTNGLGSCPYLGQGSGTGVFSFPSFKDPVAREPCAQHPACPLWPFVGRRGLLSARWLSYLA